MTAEKWMDKIQKEGLICDNSCIVIVKNNLGFVYKNKTTIISTTTMQKFNYT